MGVQLSSSSYSLASHFFKDIKSISRRNHNKRWFEWLFWIRVIKSENSLPYEESSLHQKSDGINWDFCKNRKENSRLEKNGNTHGVFLCEKVSNEIRARFAKTDQKKGKFFYGEADFHRWNVTLRVPTRNTSLPNMIKLS